MSPDSALVVFTSLGFASIFLALVIGITGHEPAETNLWSHAFSGRAMPPARPLFFKATQA